MFIKTIKSSAGYPAKINGRRTQPPDRDTFADKTFENFERAIGHI
jgi:hypothetical protein